jgi:hypothetical protein
MREINVTEIENTVRDLCIKANRFLPKSLVDCIGCSVGCEKSPTGREVLADLMKNIEAAETENYFLKLDENSSLSIPDAFSNLYFLYLKLKAQAKAKEMINYANTSMEFLSLYSDYKRGSFSDLLMNLSCHNNVILNKKQ